LAGRTQDGIARELGVHTTLVGKVLSRERCNARVREALAAAIGLSPEAAWGEMSLARLDSELRHRLEVHALAQAQAVYEATRSIDALPLRAA
jgi:hypothetical protein